MTVGSSGAVVSCLGGDEGRMPPRRLNGGLNYSQALGRGNRWKDDGRKQAEQGILEGLNSRVNS